MARIEAIRRLKLHIDGRNFGRRQKAARRTNYVARWRGRSKAPSDSMR